MADTTVEVIKRYLEDAIAAERSFEAQLHSFAKESLTAPAKAVFEEHATQTRQQLERLTRRLEALGGAPSTAKSLLTQVFNLAPRPGGSAHGPERSLSDLVLAFAIENHECAMYEALASIADAAGDSDTASLARSIQGEEKATADKIWRLLGSAAATASAGPA